MRDVGVVCPIEPYELTKPMRQGFDDLVRRVALTAAVKGGGRDLLLRVYLAGFYHGNALTEARIEP